MRERESNVLSLLEDRTNDYARKIALGMKTTFGWRDHRELFQVIVSTELSLQPSSPKGQTHAQVILDSPKQPSYPLNIT